MKARRASEASHSIRHTARHFFKSKAQIRHILAILHPLQNRKTHDLHRIFNGQSWVLLGALEGTRIPGPLIKSQMLYRLSYERIFSVLHILPNNNTTTAPKKQEGSAKKWPVHRPQRSRPLSFMKKTPGQPCALAATPSLQMGRKPVQSKQNAPPCPVCGGAF